MSPFGLNENVPIFGRAAVAALLINGDINDEWKRTATGECAGSDQEREIEFG
jgi:hypothetical protein